MSAYISKADIEDDIVDDFELLSDASATYNFTSTTVVSTDAGTKAVTVNLTVDGEGILTGRDARIEYPDIAIITGTSGGLGDGTFTVASVESDTQFTVAETIGTSTGGSVQFRKPSGSKKVGFDPTGTTLGTTVLQGTLQQIYYDNLLENDPDDVGISYSATYGGAGEISTATWQVTSTARTLKTEAYTYISSKINTLVTKVFDPTDGTTIKAQTTKTYGYTGTKITSVTTVRNV